MMAALFLAIIGWSHVVLAAEATSCPDISGRYSIKGTGSRTWSALTDALAALHAKDAGYLDSGIELSGASDGTLSVWTKSGRSGHWSTRPVAVLRAGIDFECQSGRLMLSTLVANAGRNTDEGKWYEGETTASLWRGTNGELSIAVRFTGSERLSLYRYDSANISIPKPGTRSTLTDSFSWPVYSDTDALPPIQPAMSEIVRDTRQRLTPQLLGNVVLTELKPSGGGTLAMLSASRSNDVLAFEERLRAADVLYETQAEPSWWNNAYHMELLIRPSGAVASSATRASVFRIEQELQRVLPMMADIDGIVATEDGYLVTLNIHDLTPVADVVRRVQLNSTLIRSMELVEESTAAGARARVARMKLRVR